MPDMASCDPMKIAYEARIHPLLSDKTQIPGVAAGSRLPRAAPNNRALGRTARPEQRGGFPG